MRNTTMVSPLFEDLKKVRFCGKRSLHRSDTIEGITYGWRFFGLTVKEKHWILGSFRYSFEAVSVTQIVAMLYGVEQNENNM